VRELTRDVGKPGGRGTDRDMALLDEPRPVFRLGGVHEDRCNRVGIQADQFSVAGRAADTSAIAVATGAGAGAWLASWSEGRQ
jgi:hypothetical protein